MTTGEWLANCSACCVPELAGAFTRARVPYHTVTGTLLAGDPAWESLRGWIEAAAAARGCAARALRLPRPQLPGHARHVLRLHADPGADRLARRDPRDRRSRRARRGRARPPRSTRKGDEIRAAFELAVPGADPIAGEIEPERFEWSARVAVGLDRLVADFALDGLTYYYRGLGDNVNERVGAGPDRRQLAAHRARHPDRGRGRPQDERRDVPARPARRGRLVHRVLRRSTSTRSSC